MKINIKYIKVTKINKIVIILLSCFLLNGVANAQNALSTNITKASNFDCTNGAIDLQINEGFPPYYIEWTGPNGFTESILSSTGNNGSEDIDDLAYGLYDVSVTDALCGSVALNNLLVECCNIELSGSITDASKNHDCDDGAINLYIQNGHAPYTVTWGKLVAIGINLIQMNTNLQGNDDGEDLTNISSGSYVVIVEDAIGCIQFQTFFVECQCHEYCTIEGNILNDICSNNNSIKTTLNCKEKGTPPYAYNWSNGSTTPDLTNISNGEYCLTVTDGDGCTFDNCWTITSTSSQPLEIHVLQVTNNTECLIREDDFELLDADCDGSIEINISGGVPPYLFSWSSQNGYTSNQQNPTELCPDQYSVEVTDSEGCLVLSEEINICCCENDLEIEVGIDDYNPLFCYPSPRPQEYNIILEPHSLTSVAAQDGYISVDIISSTETFGDNFHYYWTGPNGYISYDEDISNLDAGEYCFHITDGCISKDRCVTLYDCNAQNLVINGVVENTCIGYSVGSIQTTISGGIPSFNYIWSNGATTASLFNLSTGTYCVSITDGHHCAEEVKCFSIQENPPIIDNSFTPCRKTILCNNKIISDDFFPYITTFINCNIKKTYCIATGTSSYEDIGYASLDIDFNECAIIGTCQDGSTELLAYGNPVYGPFIQSSDNCSTQSICIDKICDFGVNGAFFDGNLTYCTTSYTEFEPSCPTGTCLVTIKCNDIVVSSECTVTNVCLESNDPFIITAPTNPVIIDGNGRKYHITTKENILEKYKHENNLSITIKEKNNLSSNIKEDLNIYPNPFNSIITIENVNIFKEKIVINVYSLLGKLIQEKYVKIDNNTNKIELNLNDLSTGVYFISIFDNQTKIRNFKIIKQN